MRSVISPPSSAPAGPARRGVASGPSSSLAAATAALASAGLKPRLARAERASAAGPPRGAGAPIAPASAGLPSLPASSLTMRWASLGPTPLARATIALSPRETAAASSAGIEHRQDRQRDAAADALDAGQLAERLALAGRAEAEQGPADPRAPAARSGCMTSPPTGPSASSVRAAGLHLIADALDIDRSHRRRWFRRAFRSRRAIMAAEAVWTQRSSPFRGLPRHRPRMTNAALIRAKA